MNWKYIYVENWLLWQKTPVLCPNLSLGKKSWINFDMIGWKFWGTMRDPCWLSDETTTGKNHGIPSCWGEEEGETDRQTDRTSNTTDLHILQVAAYVLLLMNTHTHMCVLRERDTYISPAVLLWMIKCWHRFQKHAHTYAHTLTGTKEIKSSTARWIILHKLCRLWLVLIKISFSWLKRHVLSRPRFKMKGHIPCFPI